MKAKEYIVASMMLLCASCSQLTDNTQMPRSRKPRLRTIRFGRLREMQN